MKYEYIWYLCEVKLNPPNMSALGMLVTLFRNGNNQESSETNYCHFGEKRRKEVKRKETLLVTSEANYCHFGGKEKK